MAPIVIERYDSCEEEDISDWESDDSGLIRELRIAWVDGRSAGGAQLEATSVAGNIS
jgi:hypothetical protein